LSFFFYALRIITLIEKIFFFLLKINRHKEILRSIFQLISCCRTLSEITLNKCARCELVGFVKVLMRASSWALPKICFKMRESFPIFFSSDKFFNIEISLSFKRRCSVVQVCVKNPISRINSRSIDFNMNRCSS